jgi:hypothetical protein
MLPVGDAETVGANISTNAEKRVHKIEDALDGFITASVEITGMPICHRASGIPRLSDF